MDRENGDPDDDPYDDSSSDVDEKAEDHGLTPHKPKQERHKNSEAERPSHHDQYGFDNRPLGIGGLVLEFQMVNKNGVTVRKILKRR